MYGGRGNRSWCMDVVSRRYGGLSGGRDGVGVVGRKSGDAGALLSAR